MTRTMVNVMKESEFEVLLTAKPLSQTVMHKARQLWPTHPEWDARRWRSELKTLIKEDQKAQRLAAEAKVKAEAAARTAEEKAKAKAEVQRLTEEKAKPEAQAQAPKQLQIPPEVEKQLEQLTRQIDELLDSPEGVPDRESLLVAHLKDVHQLLTQHQVPSWKMKHHVIFDYVYDAAKKKVANAEVFVFDAFGGTASQTRSDTAGFYYAVVPEAGDYRLEIAYPSGEIGIVEKVIVTSAVITGPVLLLPGAVPPGPAAAPIAVPPGPPAAWDDQRFPLLVTDTALGSATGAADVSSYGRKVDLVLRSTLRTAPKTTKGFRTALDQVFSIREFEGRTVVNWDPKSFVGTTLGAGTMTPAQSRLAAKAKDAEESGLALIDGLYALKPDADPQDFEAVRVVVRHNFEELVEELQKDDLPRADRVDDLLIRVKRRFAKLIAIGGLVLNNAKTADEEQNFANAKTVDDYIRDLDTRWQTYKQERGSFFTWQVPFLSRALQGAADDVTSVESAMDSVYLNEGERAALPINTADPQFTVAEALKWIRDYTSSEAPQLVEDGDLAGIKTIAKTLGRLLLVTARIAGMKNNDRIQHKRVLSALAQLYQQLWHARDISDSQIDPRNLRLMNGTC